MRKHGLYRQAIRSLTPLRCWALILSFVGAQLLIAAHTHEGDDHHHHTIVDLSELTALYDHHGLDEHDGPSHTAAECSVCLLGDRLDDEAHTSISFETSLNAEHAALSARVVAHVSGHRALSQHSRAPPVL